MGDGKRLFTMNSFIGFHFLQQEETPVFIKLSDSLVEASMQGIHSSLSGYAPEANRFDLQGTGQLDDSGISTLD